LTEAESDDEDGSSAFSDTGIVEIDGPTGKESPLGLSHHLESMLNDLTNEPSADVDTLLQQHYPLIDYPLERASILKEIGSLAKRKGASDDPEGLVDEQILHKEAC
jgi:hypothetical protein